MELPKLEGKEWKLIEGTLSDYINVDTGDIVRVKRLRKHRDKTGAERVNLLMSNGVNKIKRVKLLQTIKEG